MPLPGTAIVLISTSRTALSRQGQALHGIRRPVGGLRHTRKQKDARAKILQRAALWDMLAKKKPREAAGLV